MISITTIDKIHLKNDSINGSVVNRARWPILTFLAPKLGPGHKITERLQI